MICTATDFRMCSVLPCRVKILIKNIIVKVCEEAFMHTCTKATHDR